MRKLPLSPRKIFSLVSEVQNLSEEARRLVVIGADAGAVTAVREALIAGASPQAAGYLVQTVPVEAGSDAMPSLNGSTGVAVLVSGNGDLSSEGLKARLAKAREADVPVVLVLTQAPGFAVSFPGEGVGAKRVVGIAPDGRPPADVLAEAVVDAAGDGSVALAARLPALRQQAIRQTIERTARQNAVIGVLFFMPGADMPVMTANQARMVLRIAAAHGEQVGLDRALELLGVVGSGFALRSLARQLLDFLPGPGWAVKGSVAYTGTQAMGRAAQAYFDGSIRLTPERLRPLADRIKPLAARLKQLRR